RLRRQQRRRPRSVSGLIELTNQNSQQRFSKNLIFLSSRCFYRQSFGRHSNAIISRIPTGLARSGKMNVFRLFVERTLFCLPRPDIITICWS
ncbi:hypothetical protein AB9F42_07225, partial [Rhizobium leguminosarum]|uniref:hypothetical protein n=1 Tax=Rhizobium leguminosarum TaxID=384 RepID=UPI003F99D08E